MTTQTRNIVFKTALILGWGTANISLLMSNRCGRSIRVLIDTCAASMCRSALQEYAILPVSKSTNSCAAADLSQSLILAKVTALQSAFITCQLRQAGSLNTSSCARLDGAINHVPHQSDSHSSAVTTHCRSGCRFRFQHSFRQFWFVACTRVILPGGPVFHRKFSFLIRRCFLFQLYHI